MRDVRYWPKAEILVARGLSFNFNRHVSRLCNAPERGTFRFALDQGIFFNEM